MFHLFKVWDDIILAGSTWSGSFLPAQILGRYKGGIGKGDDRMWRVEVEIYGQSCHGWWFSRLEGVPAAKTYRNGGMFKQGQVMANKCPALIKNLCMNVMNERYEWMNEKTECAYQMFAWPTDQPIDQQTDISSYKSVTSNRRFARST